MAAGSISTRPARTVVFSCLVPLSLAGGFEARGLIFHVVYLREQAIEASFLGVVLKATDGIVVNEDVPVDEVIPGRKRPGPFGPAAPYPCRSAMARPELHLPPGFTGLPMDSTAERTAANVRELAIKVTGATSRPSNEVQAELAMLAEILADKNVRLLGKFSAEDNSLDEPATGTLAILVQSLGSPDDNIVAQAAENRQVLVNALVKQYRERNPVADARSVELPIGPALVAVFGGDYHLPPEITGNPKTQKVPEFTAEFQIPTPDASHLVMMTIKCNNETGWPAVANTAMRIAESIKIQSREPDDESTFE
jgi:hypothetical protein